MKIRLLYNLRDKHPMHKSSCGPHDLSADWDTPGTIQCLEKSLRNIGFDVIGTCYDQEIVKDWIRSDSLIFSICEMTGGAYREALISSLCDEWR